MNTEVNSVQIECKEDTLLYFSHPKPVQVRTSSSQHHIIFKQAQITFSLEREKRALHVAKFGYVLFGYIS